MPSDELILIWKLYWPLLGVLLAIIAMLLAKRRLNSTSDKVEQEDSTVEISLGFLSVPVRVKRSWFVYGFCSCAAIWSLSIAFTRDYSAFFPPKLRLEVFYDRAGLEATLSRLSAASGKDILVADNWWKARSAYYSLLDREAAPSLGKVVSFFVKADTGVHSIGETTFVVKKIGGWQNYHIEESDGEVLHTLETPNEPTRTLLTSFQKLDTSSDYLRPTFGDLVVRRTILLQPRFKQYLSAKRAAASIPFKITVVGMTAVRIFPIPEFSNTLYLADVPDIGLVPIAYAVYVPDSNPGGGAPE